MALADFQALVDDMVRDQSGTVSAEARNRAIEQARVRYSVDCLRTLVLNITWPVAGVFGPVPADWGDFSAVKHALYAGQPVVIDSYRTPDGWGLECVDALPEGAVVQLTYTTGHLLSDAVDTIPPLHRLPVASHAAWQLCNQLAAYYSGQRETTINADSSSTESRSRDYAARAKEYRSAYFIGTGQPDPYAHLGAKSAGSASSMAAAAVGNWPGRPRNRWTRGQL